jgi:C-terminal processing protease CtpA/Prc
MNRSLRVVGIFASIGVVVFLLWLARTHSVRRPGQESLKDTIHSAITNPAAFAKAHFTGGVGVIMSTNSANGLPQINEVMAGSPAEEAGLREGDVIQQIDGISTSGRTLAQNVESIRGSVLAGVTLTVQRNGSTNLQFVLHRNSWKRLGVPR